MGVDCSRPCNHIEPSPTGTPSDTARLAEKQILDYVKKPSKPVIKPLVFQFNKDPSNRLLLVDSPTKHTSLKKETNIAQSKGQSSEKRSSRRESDSELQNESIKFHVRSIPMRGEQDYLKTAECILRIDTSSSMRSKKIMNSKDMIDGYGQMTIDS